MFNYFPFSVSLVDVLHIATVSTPRQRNTHRYIAPSETSCCQLGREIATYGYKQCANDKHDIYEIDQLVNSGSNSKSKKKKLIPLRLLKKCEYRYSDNFAECCAQTKNLKKFKSFISKARKALKKALSLRKYLRK